MTVKMLHLFLAILATLTVYANGDQVYVRADDSTQRSGIIVMRDYAINAHEVRTHATVITQKELLAEPAVKIYNLIRTKVGFDDLATGKQWAKIDGAKLVLSNNEEYTLAAISGKPSSTNNANDHASDDTGGDDGK